MGNEATNPGIVQLHAKDYSMATCVCNSRSIIP